MQWMRQTLTFELGEEGANVVYLNPWTFCNDLILEVDERCSRELVETFNSLCRLRDLCVSVVNVFEDLPTEAQRSQRLHRELTGVGGDVTTDERDDDRSANDQTVNDKDAG